MALDPSIALGYRPPQVDLQIPNPVQQYATVMSLRDMMTRQQAGQIALQQQQLGLQQAQLQAEERKRLADYFASQQTGAGAPGQVGLGTLDYGNMMRIAPNLAPGIIKAHSDALEAQYKAQDEHYKVQQDQINRLGTLARGITDEPSKIQALATALGEGLITPPQRDQYANVPWNDPKFAAFQQQALSANDALTQQREAAQLAIQRSQEARAAALAGPQLEEAKTKALVAGLGAAAQTIPNNQADWDAWRSSQPPEIRRRIPAMYSPDAAAMVQRFGMTAEQQATAARAAQTAAETARHNVATEATASGQLGVARSREAREQNIYNQTYGPGANEALVGVEPKLRTAATAAAQKAADEIVKSTRTADELQNFINLARQGNKAAYANMPVAGVLDITTANGTTRINRQELEAYGGAGSLLDKLQGKVSGALTGAKIPKDVLDDIEKLHQSIRQGAENAYNQKLDAINQNYHANFKPVTKAQPSGTINVISPEGVPGTIPVAKWDEAQKRGFKKQ